MSSKLFNCNVINNELSNSTKIHNNSNVDGKKEFIRHKKLFNLKV